MSQEMQRLFLDIEGRIADWAGGRADISAALVVGSRARVRTPADAYSDLDLILIVSDPAPFIATGSWLSQIGPYWLTFLEPTADGTGTERRVMFEGGVDVDFVPVPETMVRKGLSEGFPPQAALLLSRGFRVIVDKRDLLGGFSVQEPPEAAFCRPSAEQFDNLINDFYYHVAWAAKKLARGETWMAKSNADCYQKRLLRQMLEWQAKAVHGPGYEVWHDGRFLDAWADQDAVGALGDCYAGYEPKDIKRAMRRTSDLFGKTAQSVAVRWDFNFPSDNIERALSWLRREGLI